MSGSFTSDPCACETYAYFQFSPLGTDHGLEGKDNWTNGSFHLVPENTANHHVEDTLSGLNAETEYEVRAAIVPFTGTYDSYFSDAPYPTFTTDPVPVEPTATLDPAANVAYTTAELQGAVDPEGGNKEAGGAYVPIHWSLELRDATADGDYGSVASGDISGEEPEGGGPIPAASTEPIKVGPAELSGLIPGHTYSYYLLTTRAGIPLASGAIESFTTLPVAKPTVTGLAVSDVTADSAHFAAQVDPHAPDPNDPAFDAAWEFICVPECPGAKGAALKGTVSGAAAPIDADAVELEPNTTYTVTLGATNAGGTEEATTTFTTPAIAPGLRDRAAGPVHADSARLNAEVDPNNSATTYWFEYGPADCSANPCQSLPAAAAGSGADFAYVSQQLTGLAPETVYHFRVLAQSAAGTAVGADQLFATPAADSACANERVRVEQRSTALPDCRAWEMVSPVDKNGGDVVPMSSRFHTAVDGDAVVFNSLTGFADARSVGVSADYLSQRTETGWFTHAITPSHAPLTLSGIVAGAQTGYEAEFTPDLSKGIYRSPGGRPGDDDVQNAANLYLRDDLRAPGSGGFRLITEATSPPDSVSTHSPDLAATSTNLSHVAFESAYGLTADAPPTDFLCRLLNFDCLPRLYEWIDGDLHLAGVLPDGTPAASSVAGTYSGYARPHVLAADGSRLVFSDDQFGEGALYSRIGAAVSVQLNRSERATPESPRLALYWDASADGTRVFFSTQEGLLDGDDNGAEDLYMWRRAGHDETQALSIDATGGSFTLSLFGRSTDPIPHDATAAQLEAALEGLRGPAPAEYPLLPPTDVSVTGPVGGPFLVSFQGHLAGVNMPQLIADSSSLTGGAAQATVATTEPVANLTRISVDQVGADQPDFLGTAGMIGASADGSYVYFMAGAALVPGAGSSNEFPSGTGIYLWHQGDLRYVGSTTSSVNGLHTAWGLPLTATASRVSPDGRYLLFVSSSDEGLAGRGGYPGTDHGSACVGEGGPCRELYLYDAATGSLECASCRPGEAAAAQTFTAVWQNGGGAFATYHAARPLSENGRYVFYSTADSLVPEDTNGVMDVYAYNSLTEAVHLLSSGVSPQPSFFMDASPSGHDVFFTTRQSLSAWDRDTSVDVYDARIGGGFPEPPISTAPCDGETCRSAGTASIPAPTPGSAALQVDGDPVPPRCPRGKRPVRRAGKTVCVKRRAKHRHRTGGRTTDHDRRAAR